MGKYIVELKKNETLYKAATRESDGTAYVCSAIGTPYTVPDLEQVRKEAYEQGQKDLRESCVPQDEEAYGIGYHEGFQCGLDLAWNAAKKIENLSEAEKFEAFGEYDMFHIMRRYTAAEAIEKLKSYEQEKHFHVGDEFENESGKRFVITKMDGTEIDRYIDEEGTTYCMIAKYKVIRKTGRHFPEITEVLAKMKEANNG